MLGILIVNEQDKLGPKQDKRHEIIKQSQDQNTSKRDFLKKAGKTKWTEQRRIDKSNLTYAIETKMHATNKRKSK